MEEQDALYWKIWKWYKDQKAMKSWSIFASIRFGPLGAGLSFHMSEMFPKRRVKTWSSFVLLKGILKKS